MIQNMLQKTTKNRAKIGEKLSPNGPNVEKNRLQNARQLKIGRGELNGGPIGGPSSLRIANDGIWPAISRLSRGHQKSHYDFRFLLYLEL